MSLLNCCYKKKKLSGGGEFALIKNQYVKVTPVVYPIYVI